MRTVRNRFRRSRHQRWIQSNPSSILSQKEENALINSDPIAQLSRELAALSLLNHPKEKVRRLVRLGYLSTNNPIN